MRKTISNHVESERYPRLTPEMMDSLKKSMVKNSGTLLMAFRSDIRVFKIMHLDCICVLTPFEVFFFSQVQKKKELLCRIHVSDLELIAYSEEKHVLLRTMESNIVIYSEESLKLAQIFYRNYQLIFSNLSQEEACEIRSSDMSLFPKITISVSPSQKFQLAYASICSKLGVEYHHEVVRYVHSLVLSQNGIFDVSQLPLGLYFNASELRPIFLALDLMKFIHGICCSSLERPNILENISLMIEQSKKLRVIHFSDCSIQNGLKLVHESFKANSDVPISYWNLDNNKIKDFDYFPSILAIARSPVLHISLNDCGIKPNQAASLFTVLEQNPSMWTIQNLHIFGIEMNEESLQAFDKFLKTLSDNDSSCLKSLNLGLFKGKLKKLLNSLNRYPQPIESLVLCQSSIDDSGVSQSLSTTVNAILALPNNISADLPFNQITGVEKTLKDAEKLFRAYGKEEIGKMLNEIAPSRTFRALAGTAQFEKILSTLKGQSIEVNGKPTTIDNAHIYALTRFNVSIGNPIANPKSFELFMKSLLGGVDIRELRHIRDILLPDDQVNYEEITALQKDILKLEKAFPKTSEDQEELLQKKGQLKAAQEKIKKNQKKRKTLKTTFDKITGSLHAMATTRGYTTKKEIQEFVQGSFTSPELRGATGLTASVINGNTQTAIRILKDQLFRKTTHETKTGVKLASFDQNIWFVEEKDPLISHPQEDSSQQKPGILNQDFFNHMIENPNQYCVVQMSHIPAGLFQELEETYPGQHQAILGRLIIVTKTNKGEASSATMVYHILPELTERLDACCDRELGRPSRIQLQLYELFSKISIEELTELKAAVEKNRQARNQQGASKSLETLSAHPYLADERSEYNMYKGFEKLLNFFIDLHDPQKRETRAKEELEEFENQYHAYFAGKDVPKKTFDCVAIPTGGGREELTMIFGYCAKQLRETAANFQEIETSGDLHPNSSKPNAVSSIIKTIKTKVRGQTGETTKSIGVCRARLNELIKKRYGSNADVTLGPLPIDTARRIVEERQNPSIATDGNLGSSILTMAGDMTEIGLREGATKVEGIAGSVRSAIEGISRMPVLNGVRKTLIGKSKRNGLNQNAKRTERSFENLGAQTAPLRAAVAGFAALPGIIETGAGRLRQFTQTEIPNLALIFNTLNALANSR
ncbi:MAG: hypothetical protein UT55_C0090G0002 [Candidatus Peregrinibacteria bacterium GW2011_GWE2_39_6]|nr:MAG: hypothetical protein UT55_C0090G0002 [Candidatus Peregrinibacteria bacterium GW2011_GWE2_39_6]